MRADSALIFHSEIVTLGQVGGDGGVRHMHLVYAARQLELGVVLGEQGGGRQRKL